MAAAKKQTATEKQIESTILDYLNRHPDSFAFKVNTVGVYDPIKGIHRRPGRFTLKGTADIIGMWKGKFLAIEVKKPGGRPTTEQKAFVKKIISMGGVAFFAFNLEDVKHHLDYFDKNGAVIVS